MLQENVDRILSQLRPTDTVLDIGGWAQPFTRANAVVDIMPYETRGIFGRRGPETEHFSKQTWFQRDACGSKPLPFKDKQFDFVVCANTLEDIRDPLKLCAEIMRVGKRGYIEVPSKLYELTLTNQYPRCAGAEHHRWLIDTIESTLNFRFKPHFIHATWKYHFPKGFLEGKPESAGVSFLFWENAFRVHEVHQMSARQMARDIAHFVEQHGPYPAFYYRWDAARSNARVIVRKAIRRSRWAKALASRWLGRPMSDSEEPLQRSQAFWDGLPELYSSGSDLEKKEINE